MTYTRSACNPFLHSYQLNYVLVTIHSISRFTLPNSVTTAAHQTFFFLHFTQYTRLAAQSVHCPSSSIFHQLLKVFLVKPLVKSPVIYLIWRIASSRSWDGASSNFFPHPRQIGLLGQICKSPKNRNSRTCHLLIRLQKKIVAQDWMYVSSSEAHTGSLNSY